MAAADVIKARLIGSFQCRDLIDDNRDRLLELVERRRRDRRLPKRYIKVDGSSLVVSCTRQDPTPGQQTVVARGDLLMMQENLMYSHYPPVLLCAYRVPFDVMRYEYAAYKMRQGNSLQWGGLITRLLFIAGKPIRHAASSPVDDNLLNRKGSVSLGLIV